MNEIEGSAPPGEGQMSLMEHLTELRYRLIKAAQKCLSNVSSPALIVHSTEDDMASLKNAYYVEKNIASEYLETMYIDDTYHVLTLDKRKDDIATRVVEFCMRAPKTQFA